MFFSIVLCFFDWTPFLDLNIPVKGIPNPCSYFSRLLSSFLWCPSIDLMPLQACHFMPDVWVLTLDSSLIFAALLFTAWIFTLPLNSVWKSVLGFRVRCFTSLINLISGMRLEFVHTFHVCTSRITHFCFISISNFWATLWTSFILRFQRFKGILMALKC